MFLLYIPRLLPVAIAGAGMQGGMSSELIWLSQPGAQEGQAALKEQRGDVTLTELMP